MRRKWRRGASALVCSAMVLAASAGPAQAVTYNYTCGVLAPNTWCIASPTKTFGYNGAYGPGGQVMWLCSKLIRASNGNVVARTCQHTNLAYVYSNYSGVVPYPNNSVNLRALSANGQNANPWQVWGSSTY